MPQVIETAAVPNQIVRATLNGQDTSIAVYAKSTGLYVDVYVAASLLIGGVIALNCNKIVRSTYLGFSGDLAFVDQQGSDDPTYDGLGSRYLLTYFMPAELPTYDIR